MTIFTRFLILFVCGVVQIFFALHMLFDWGFYERLSILNAIPGLLVILGWGLLVLAYVLGTAEENHVLYDEYTIDRFHRLASLGFVLNCLGVFSIFLFQDYSAWSLELATEIIAQLAAYLWLVFGVLLILFSFGDYKESLHDG